MIQSVKEIRDLDKDLEEYYQGLRKEQKADDEYYNDTFNTPLIEQPYHVVRTGRAARLVDTPAEHIITSNPQAFVEERKSVQKSIETAIKQGKLYNHWLRQLKLNNPDPMKEFVKNLLRRGEAYYQVLFNENFARENNNILPVFFLTPDPMLVKAYPEENRGIPRAVIVKYKRLSWIVQERWSEWEGSNRKEVDWLEYLDKDVRYFEADGKPVLKDEIQKNIYGFVPFVHSYSGAGKSSPDGKPESLAVSIIRVARPLLLEECQLRSLIDSIVHLYTHPIIDLIPLDAQAQMAIEKFDYSVIPGRINPLPFGIKVDKDRGTPPAAELFTHLQDIEYRLDLLLPRIMGGIATSSRSSGRLEDLLYTYSSYKYDTIIENTEKALGIALDLGRRIMVRVPQMLPITITASTIKKGEKVREEEKIDKEDLTEEHQIKVQLSAADPIDEDRRSLLFRSYFNDGIIDWETCLIEGLGKTPDEAKEIQIKVYVDQVKKDPIFRGLIARKVMEKIGATEELMALEQSEAKRQEMAATPPPPTSQGGTAPRTLNITNPESYKMVDMILSQRAARKSPGRPLVR